MLAKEIVHIGIYLGVVLLLVKPLGWYIAEVYQGRVSIINRIFLPFEKRVYKVCGIHPETEMDWKQYLISMLLFDFIGIIFVYFLQRVQLYLPFNPESISGMSPELSFNSAISFATNTNWQAYTPVTALSYLTHTMALTVQNFLSAATGMSLLIAITRGLVRTETQSLGNFWEDTLWDSIYSIAACHTFGNFFKL